MKVLTLWQPWASLIMIGAKPYEFRSWDYTSRLVKGSAIPRGVGVEPGERIGIHAGARPIRPAEVVDLLDRLDDPAGTTGLVAGLARPLLETLMRTHKCRGVIEMAALLGTAVLGKPVLSCDLKPEWAALIADSDRLEHCNFAWPLTDIRRLPAPIPMNGMQGFWNCPVPEKDLAA